MEGTKKKSSLSCFQSETSRVIIPRKEEGEEEIRENTAELSYQAGGFVAVWSGRVNLYG